MKCKCSNNIEVKMASKVECRGCKMLTSMIAVLTVECNNRGERFQIPISSENIQNKKLYDL